MSVELGTSDKQNCADLVCRIEETFGDGDGGCKVATWQAIPEDLFSQNVMQIGLRVDWCTSIGTLSPAGMS